MSDAAAELNDPRWRLWQMHDDDDLPDLVYSNPLHFNNEAWDMDGIVEFDRPSSARHVWVDPIPDGHVRYRPTDPDAFDAGMRGFTVGMSPNEFVNAFQRWRPPLIDTLIIPAPLEPFRNQADADRYLDEMARLLINPRGARQVIDIDEELPFPSVTFSAQKAAGVRYFNALFGTPPPPPPPAEDRVLRPCLLKQSDLTLVNDDDACIICMTRKPRTLTVPCGHVGLCIMCARKRVITTCPLCRAELTEIKRT